jgi:hypothetical protein
MVRFPLRNGMTRGFTLAALIDRADGGAPATQAVALELEAMSIVDDAVEDGVSEGRLAGHGAMPY